MNVRKTLLTLHLKPRKHERIANGHLWAFAGEIAESLKEFEPGEAVTLCEARGAILGRGYVNPKSLIAVRLLTRGEEPWDDDLFKRRITAAYEYRQNMCRGWESYRLIHAESDGLPGLVVDKFGDHLVLMSLTAGIESRLEEIVKALVEVVKPQSILLKGSSHFRSLEGLPQVDRQLLGETPDEILFKENDLIFAAHPHIGQKTGFFLDQRMNRSMMAGLVAGKSVLDLFCYTGTWGLLALKQGAESALMVDSSQLAIDWTRVNAERNGLQAKAEYLKSDVLDLLKEFSATDRKFDVVILDPPALIPARSALEKGSRLYKSLNIAAMKVLSPGGMLVTCSCSHLMDTNRHLELIGRAAMDAGRRVRLALSGGAPPDHPVLPGHPETKYLKCWYLYCD